MSDEQEISPGYELGRSLTTDDFRSRALSYVRILI